MQKIILEAGQETTEHSRKWLSESEDKIKKELHQKDTEISNPADGEKEFINLAAEAVMPKFHKRIDGKENIANMMKQ